MSHRTSRIALLSLVLTAAACEPVPLAPVTRSTIVPVVIVANANGPSTVHVRVRVHDASGGDDESSESSTPIVAAPTVYAAPAAPLYQPSALYVAPTPTYAPPQGPERPWYGTQ